MIAAPISAPALAEAAPLYAERGWHVFPLLPRTKRPATKHGLKDATTNAATIRAWWKIWPDANIGCACGPSGLVVVDLDGAEGIAAWELLAQRLGIAPATTVVRTGGGGLHLYFAARPGVEIRNSAGKLASGVDVRGVGGYVVLPPSIHPSGCMYEWASEL